MRWAIVPADTRDVAETPFSESRNPCLRFPSLSLRPAYSLFLESQSCAMPSSSSSSSSSPLSSSSTPAKSSFSVFSVFQYAFLALAAYVLAGAPLQEMLLRGGVPGSQGGTYASREGSVGFMSPQKLETVVVPDANLSCGEHSFGGVHVLSREPLVVYIEGFLSKEETDEVVELRYVVNSNYTLYHESVSHVWPPAPPCSNRPPFGPPAKSA